MRILIFSKSYLPDLGGLERNTDTLKNTLEQIGHDCVVLTETLKNFPNEKNIIRTKSLQTQLKAIRNFDLLFVNGGVALKPLLLSILCGTSRIILYANATLTAQNSNRGLKAFLENAFRKFIANTAVANLTLTEVSGRLLDVKTPKFILKNPIDYELEKMVGAITSNHPKIYDLLFCGRLIEGKGIFLLIDALVILKKKNTTLKVAFAGEGPHENSLIEYAKKHQIDIKILGRLDGFPLVSAYVSSKVLVLPSTSHIEGSPLVIGEAITFGLPVIVSDQPAMIETAGKGGIAFESGNSQDLSEKIEGLFNNQESYFRLRNVLENESKRFSLVHYKNQLSSILSAISHER